MSAPTIVVDDLTVRYQDVVALDRASVTVRPGVVTGLIGMNGSGKSTLFKTIMGLVRPTTGTVTIAQRPPAEARRSGLVGYVPQSEEVDWAFPICVRDVVMMGRYGRLGFTRGSRAVDHAAVNDALARTGLSDLADRQIGQLSGGQRKRAFVARGLAQQATVMLLDEPFAGVDRTSEAMIVNLLRDLAAGGCTIVVSTHDLQRLSELADEAILLLHSVLFHGDVAEALAPSRLVTAFGMAANSPGDPS